MRDDAALFAPVAGQELVLTCDAIVCGVHFLPDDPPDTVARKALRVNLSDLAAKGAHPAGCLMTLALPEHTTETWLESFAGGLHSDCELFSCPLLGGDTVRTEGPLWVSVFALGSLPQGSMVRREGAEPGDRVLLTGTVGDAVLGLQTLREPYRVAGWSLSEDEASHLLGRYRVPQPRVAMADVVRDCASAAMDVSDGLVGDLTKLCDVSKVSARLELSRIPLSPAAARAAAAQADAMEKLLTGGDDYEILATVAPERMQAFRDGAERAGIAIADIGEIVAGLDAPQVIGEDRRALSFARRSFSHF